MLTTTATFDKYSMRPNAKAKFLMTIVGVSPSRTFYLADDRIALSTTGEKFEGIVKDWGSLKKTIDLFTKKVNVGNVRINLVNAPYKTGDVSISDDLSSSKYINRVAKIYLWFEGITSLSDCLKIFEGLVQPLENTTPETVDLLLTDATFKRHLIIPPDKVNLTDWPDAPTEKIGLPLPLHYGAFSINKEDNAPIDGAIAEGVWISANKVVIADHAFDSITAVWIYDEAMGELAKVDSADYTTNINDSGRATVAFDVVNPTLEVWLYPITTEMLHIDDPDYVLLDSEMPLIRDKDDTTFMEATVASYTPNGNQDDEFESRVHGRIKSAAPIGTLDAIYLEARYDTTGFNESLQFYQAIDFWDEATQSGVGDFSLSGTETGAYDSLDITTTYETAGLSLQNLSSPNGVRLRVRGLKRVADGTRQKIGEYYDMRLRVTYKRFIESSMRVFVEGNGREYGTWIDGIGRSNSYNSGDMIENPAGIIESLLREEMGIGTTEIDQDSFDDALGDLVSWDHVVSIMDFINTEDLIKQICRQAKMNFFFSNDDRAKVPVIDNSPTTEDDKLYLNDVDRSVIKLARGKIQSLINKIKISYNRGLIDDKLKSFTEAENTTSQSDYGITIEKHRDAPFIFQDSVADLLRDHFSGASSGFWKDLRQILEVDMLSWEHIDWEVGDLIEPQSDIDSVLKDFDTGWGTQLLMIIEKQITKDGIFFKMIKAN